MGQPGDEPDRGEPLTDRGAQRSKLEKTELAFEIADARDRSRRLGLLFAAHLLDMALLEVVQQIDD